MNCRSESQAGVVDFVQLIETPASVGNVTSSSTFDLDVHCSCCSSSHSGSSCCCVSKQVSWHQFM